MVEIAFIGFLAAFFLIGVSCYYFSQGTTADYLVAGKSVSAPLIGLSAVATNNSGFMFIGMIGATYSMGLSSIWLMIGWIVGDFLVQRTAVVKINQVGASNKVHSFGGLLSLWISSNQSSSDSTHRLRQFIGILTLLFLTVYAAAQLKAGTKATEVVLGWDASSGILIAALIIFVYSLVGGLRASIWTDVAQSLIMLLGMMLIVFYGWQSINESGAFWQQLNAISANYLFWFPVDSGITGAMLFVIGWVFGGMGVIGQPHIVIRFITLSPDSSVTKMQVYYYFWFTLFYGMTIIAGLISRILLPEIGDFDAELALPMLSENLMPEVFVGLLLAALFAATMSTVDSLILACSAAFSRDFTAQPINKLWINKLATLVILTVAVLIALSNNQTVFALVLDTWGMLGSAFGALIIWLAIGKKVSVAAAFVAIVTGMSVFALFTLTGWWSMVYALTFGFSGSFLSLWILNRLPR
ncbi:Sodium/proline symporter [uncultured Thiomicrorhabdus sp.]